MASQKELDSVYMATALQFAKLSKAKRAKVGSVLVTPIGILVPGVNGLPKALGNELEYEVDGKLVTKPSVIHSEQACLNKAAKMGVSIDNSTLYVTLSPCQHCAANMIASGITRVVFLELYRDNTGLQLLQQAGILVEQINLED